MGTSGSDVRAPIDPGLLDSGFYAFRREFDPEHGGFGGAPKFPAPLGFELPAALLGAAPATERRWRWRWTTLRAMAKGGMNDQLGGGFHRYSVDERWFVPHFEKMLYDQAQLADLVSRGLSDYWRRRHSPPLPAARWITCCAI